MASGKEELIGELKHEINSPLAAIRNALYLAAARARDPEVRRYLRLADEEVSRIAKVLNEAEQLVENKRLLLYASRSEAAPSAA
jgi:signal transduction histidine kinase